MHGLAVRTFRDLEGLAFLLAQSRCARYLHGGGHGFGRIRAYVGFLRPCRSFVTSRQSPMIRREFSKRDMPRPADSTSVTLDDATARGSPPYLIRLRSKDCAPPTRGRPVFQAYSHPYHPNCSHRRRTGIPDSAPWFGVSYTVRVYKSNSDSTDSGRNLHGPARVTQ